MVLAAVAVAIWPRSRAITAGGRGLRARRRGGPARLRQSLAKRPARRLGDRRPVRFAVPRIAERLERVDWPGLRGIAVGGRRYLGPVYVSLMEPEVTAASSDARDLAVRARDRVHFEEDALTYADDAYRVARRLTVSTEAAEELVQDAYVRAFRPGSSTRPAPTCGRGSCASSTTSRSTPGASATHAADGAGGGERLLPLPAHGRHLDAEEADTVVERLSQGGVVSALAALPSRTATRSCSSTSPTSPIRTPPTSSTSRSERSCRASTVDGACSRPTRPDD